MANVSPAIRLRSARPAFDRFVGLSAVVRKDITIYTSRGEGGNNVKRAVALAAAGKIRGAELVTHRFALDDIAEAFRVVAERDGDPLKVVVVP